MLENQMMRFQSKKGNSLVLRAIPGHFATSHSHINYYLDMAWLKARRSEASMVAQIFVAGFPSNLVVDTIVCMEGSEVIGAYLAEELEKNHFYTSNAHRTVYIVTPEINMNNQMLFRDNIIPAIKGKNVLILQVTATTGISIERSINSVEYYGGITNRICSVFSAVDTVAGRHIDSIFTLDDVPGYAAYPAYECPFCKEKIKLDALVNGHGYSKL